jgi:hypothetical protein
VADEDGGCERASERDAERERERERGERRQIPTRGFQKWETE